MKVAAVLLLALGAAPVVAFAAPSDASIEVTAPTAREALATSVNRALDRRLTRNLRLLASSNSFERGFVTVRFKADASGQANSVEVTRPSGSRRFDALALRSVLRMNMGALPSGVTPNQLVVAHIIVSSDQREIDKYRTEIASAMESPHHLAAESALVVSLVTSG